MTTERPNLTRSAGTLRRPLAEWFFPLAKACVRAIPEWLLRFRPYGVFEIRVGRQQHQLRVPIDRGCRRIEWVGTLDDLHLLGDLIDKKNATLWDGDRCRAAAVWQNDVPVGVAWIAMHAFAEPELGIRFRLHADEVWLFASVVAPEWRRQGVYSDLLTFFNDELTRAGIRRVLCGISVGNSASLAAHRKAGAQQLGYVFAAKSLGVVCCRTGGAVKRTCSRAIAWRRPIEVGVA